MNEIENKLNEVEKFDFSSNETFDVNSVYETVNGFKVERENLKAREAENMISSLGTKYIDAVNIDMFMEKRENLRNLMRRYSADSELLKAMPDVVGGERDKIYAIANYLYNKFALQLNDMKMNITFSYDEFDFIIKTVNQKLEYNADEIFQVIKLKNDCLDGFAEDFKKLKKDEDMRVEMTINNIILLYHLLAKYKAHGVNKQFDIFANILNKIGETNQVFNSLNILKDRLNEEFMHWTTTITTEQKIVPESQEVK